MKKHLLKSLLALALVLVCGNVWGETKTYEWDLTSASNDWAASLNEIYFTQPYGFKKINGTLTNQSIDDFQIDGISQIKVGFKCLQNGGSTSKITIWLVDKDGNTLGEGVVVTPVNASAASNTAYVYATFNSNLADATGFKMKVTTFGKNILVNGASYEVTYTSSETATTHDVLFYVNGSQYGSPLSIEENSPISFPADPEPIEGNSFIGWSTATITGITDDVPSMVNKSSATMGTEDIIYYAVFATKQIGEFTLTQTLQYDTWTYSGSTTDKSTYRLFHSGSYIESAEFDLSTLAKVVVYGGTFGGANYNSLTIGDGTNTWKSVTVSGNSEKGTNEYTDGTALSGTGKLRITSNSGTSSNYGVRISKVEIYTAQITITGYCTAVAIKSLVSIAISGTPDKTEYKEGDTFDPAGLVVTGNYNDNSTKEITDGITWTVDPEALTTTTTSVSVTATVDGKSDTKAYSVTVNPKPEYTIIFKAPGEDIQSSVKEGSAVANVPTAEGNQEWSFVGWSNVEVSKTTKKPALVDFNEYVVYANATFYPIFSKSTSETSKTATSSNLSASTDLQILEKEKPISYKVSSNNGYSNPLRVYKNSKLTISGATITQIVLEGADTNYAISYFTVGDGNWTWNSSETLGTWTGRSESVVFTASEAQARVNTITVTYIVPGITYYASTIPVTVTLTGAPSNGLYYATFIGSTNMKVDDNSVIATCFVEDGMAKTNELEGNIIPANSPVIVYTMNEDGKITLTQTTEDASAEDAEYIKDEDFNMLFGYTEDTHVDAADNTCYYALNVVDGQAGFFVPRTTDDTTNPSASNGFTAKAGKAYLKVADATPSNGYRFGGTTLIEDIKIDNDAVYYNLLGQKVENPTNGLYIHNGKKVYVK